MNVERYDNEQRDNYMMSVCRQNSWFTMFAINLPLRFEGKQMALDTFQEKMLLIHIHYSFFTCACTDSTGCN